MSTISTTEKQRKVISFGKVAYYGNRKINEITVEIELRAGSTALHWETLEPIENIFELSICGNVWNGSHTDIVSGGQNIDELVKLIRTPKMRRIHAIWQAYHLNDTRAGTKTQTAYLDGLKAAGWKYDYSAACEQLKSIGLYEDKGYKYGHGWLYQPIPQDVIDEINELLK